MSMHLSINLESRQSGGADTSALDTVSCHAFGFLGAQQDRHRIRCRCRGICYRPRRLTHSTPATIVMATFFNSKTL